MKKHLYSSMVSLPTLLALFVILAWPSPSYASGYWTSFKKYWTGFVEQQNGVVLMTVVLGSIAIFIVTRGKWRK